MICHSSLNAMMQTKQKYSAWQVTWKGKYKSFRDIKKYSPHACLTVFDSQSEAQFADLSSQSETPLRPGIGRGQRLCYSLSEYTIVSLKIGKASGPDRIPVWFLKEFAAEIAPVLCRLFRLILKTCIFPAAWKYSLVQPVPKKGDRSNPSNYRPIALTSTIAKVFESLLNSHIVKHLETNSLLSDHQYGFRKARSTGDLLSYLTGAAYSKVDSVTDCK